MQGGARIPGIIVGASVPGAPFHRHNRTLTVMHLAVKKHPIFVSHCISSKYKNKMSLECSISRSQGTHQILVDQSQNSPEVVGTNYEKPLSVYSERGFEWCHRESNQGHKDFQSFALPTELWHQILFRTTLSFDWDCKGRHFFRTCKFFRTNFTKMCFFHGFWGERDRF